jgi:hypothetical protein
MHEICARCAGHLLEDRQSCRSGAGMGLVCGATQYLQLAVVLVKHGSPIAIFGARSASGFGSICIRNPACAPYSQEVTVTNNRNATPNIYSPIKEQLIPNIK